MTVVPFPEENPKRNPVPILDENPHPTPVEMPELPEVGAAPPEQDDPEQPNEHSNPTPQRPPVEPFSGAEIARALTGGAVFGLGAMGILRSKPAAQAFAAVFNRPTLLIPPQMAAGLEIMADVEMANLLDSLSAGDLLASVGIGKRFNLSLESLSFLPPWMRGLLAVGVVGAAAFGGVIAARQVDNQQQTAASNSGSPGVNTDGQ